jgi:hypothetical protein
MKVWQVPVSKSQYSSAPHSVSAEQASPTANPVNVFPEKNWTRKQKIVSHFPLDAETGMIANIETRIIKGRTAANILFIYPLFLAPDLWLFNERQVYKHFYQRSLLQLCWMNKFKYIIL